MFLYALKIYIKYSLNQMFDIAFKQPILFNFHRSIEIHQYLNQSILTIVVIYLVYSIIVIEFIPIQIVSSRCVSLWLPAERATCEWLTAEFKLALIHTCRGEFKSCTGCWMASEENVTYIENAEDWRMHYDLNRQSLG